MDLIKSIRIFRRVAELGSFTDAGRELALSQPTVSKTVAHMEAELGVTLLRRTTRGISLTSEGQTLLQSGARLLEQADAVVSSVKNEKMLLKGTIKLSASLGFARLVLAPLCGAFHETHPDLRMVFHLSDGYVDLVEQDIDLAIRIGSLSDSSLKAIKIGRSDRKLFATKAYLKKFGVPKGLDDLSAHRLLYYTRLSERPHWPFVDAKGKAKPFYFEPFFRSDGSDLIREVALHDVGIVFMPTWMAREKAAKSTMVPILESLTTVTSPIYVVSANTSGLSAKQRAVVEFLRGELEKIGELSLRGA